MNCIRLINKHKMIDINGKIILTEEGLIKQAANGHGGIFEAMFNNGIVEDMKKREIEWVFIGPVDNPLVQMTDEIAIGYASEKNVLALGKYYTKSHAKLQAESRTQSSTTSRTATGVVLPRFNRLSNALIALYSLVTFKIRTSSSR